MACWARPGGRVEHLEQRAKDRDVDFLRRFDVLELFQLVQRPFGEQGELAGVDFVASDGKDDVTRVDQPAQNGDEEVRLEAKFDRGEMLDVGISAE